MRLRVHLIAPGGRCYRAGEDVPDEDLSPRLMKYAVTDDPEEKPIPKPPVKQPVKLKRKSP